MAKNQKQIKHRIKRRNQRWEGNKNINQTGKERMSVKIFKDRWNISKSTCTTVHKLRKILIFFLGGHEKKYKSNPVQAHPSSNSSYSHATWTYHHLPKSANQFLLSFFLFNYLINRTYSFSLLVLVNCFVRCISEFIFWTQLGDNVMAVIKHTCN